MNKSNLPGATKRNKMKNLYLGISFDHFYLGLFCLIVSVVLIVIIPVVGWIAFIPALIVFISPKGIEFDLINKRFYPYYHYLFGKIGSWEKYNEKFSLRLTLKSEFMIGSPFSSDRQGRRKRWHETSFLVSLYPETGDRFELEEFPEYEDAIAFLEKWSRELELEGINAYGASVEQSLANRSKKKSGRIQRRLISKFRK